MSAINATDSSSYTSYTSMNKSTNLQKAQSLLKNAVDIDKIKEETEFQTKLAKAFQDANALFKAASTDSRLISKAMSAQSYANSLYKQRRTMKDFYLADESA